MNKSYTQVLRTKTPFEDGETFMVRDGNGAPVERWTVLDARAGSIKVQIERLDR